MLFSHEITYAKKSCPGGRMNNPQKKHVLHYLNKNLKPFSLFQICLCLLLLCAVAGCAKKAEEKKTTLHFVTWKPNITEVWDEIFNIFASEHPDIEITKEIGPHSSTAFHDLLTQKLKNQSKEVDVFLMDVIWPPEFAAAGWAMPLDELFPESERRKFMDGSILANSFGAHIYGVPLFIDSGVLYYRKDLLETYGFMPPGTWEEMVSQADIIVSGEAEKGNEIYGFSGQFKQYEGLVCDMQEYILSHGGMILDPETGRSGLVGAPAIEAVSFVREEIIGKAAPVGVLTYQEPESLDLFIQGKAVFHRNWPYAWRVSNNPERSKISGKVGIVKLPHFKGNRSYSTLGGWQVGISNYSEDKDAAWEFVTFLSSSRIQKLFALKAGLAPTRKALYEDAEILKSHPHFSHMKDGFLTAYPRPRTPLYPAVSNVLQRYFSKAISSKKIHLETEALEASEAIEKIIAMEK
jgi:multiple sugar transport system substrate-binding protein